MNFIRQMVVILFMVKASLQEEQVRCFCPNHVIVRVSWLYGTGGLFCPFYGKISLGTERCVESSQ